MPNAEKGCGLKHILRTPWAGKTSLIAGVLGDGGAEVQDGWGNVQNLQGRAGAAAGYVLGQKGLAIYQVSQYFNNQHYKVLVR